MTFICIIYRYIYGESGTELPPPRTGTQVFVETSRIDENLIDFKSRMADLVLPLRRKVDVGPIRPYGRPDGWDWAVYEAKPLSSYTEGQS